MNPPTEYIGIEYKGYLTRKEFALELNTSPATLKSKLKELGFIFPHGLISPEKQKEARKHLGFAY